MKERLSTNLEIPTVREELYVKTREALAKEGFTFVVAIEPISIGQLVTDTATSQLFGYVNYSRNMRIIVPSQMEVAINSKQLRIKNSNSKTTDDQIRKIKTAEKKLKSKLPEEVRGLISMRMQSASVLAQLDFKYQEETGKVLFTNWYGRTDDQTSEQMVSDDHVANVGRDAPSDLLSVVPWRRDVGDGHIFAVPAVVLPRKASA